MICSLADSIHPRDLFSGITSLRSVVAIPHSDAFFRIQTEFFLMTVEWDWSICNPADGIHLLDLSSGITSLRSIVALSWDRDASSCCPTDGDGGAGCIGGALLYQTGNQHPSKQWAGGCRGQQTLQYSIGLSNQE